MVLDLGGKWNFHEVGSTDWQTGTVPGCNFTDLLDNKMIDDPFVGTNENSVQWIAEKDWEYTREFTLPAAMLKSPTIMLECDMIDTISEIYINDKLLGKTDNAHIQWVYNITDYVCKLTNKIRIKLLSPNEYVETKQSKDAMPHNNMGITGVPHIRKPQCHMGWDWGPILPFSGILRGIRIASYDIARFDDILIQQTHGDNMVTLDIVCDILNNDVEGINVNYTLKGANGRKIEQKSGDNHSQFVITNPQLWYPNDISETDIQPLYTITAELLIGDKIVDRITKKIGLRTIVVNQEADKYGNNFQFVVNGVPIFAKGANWIPADSFINRCDYAQLKYLLGSMQNANMNMIRIWGGGYYECEDFYDLCDEMGILVWQDFCFACAPYPFYNQQFLDNVKAEIEYNVKRLRHRASLAIWCGNNEIEAMTAGWMTKRKLIQWEETFFYEILPNELIKYDTVTQYIAGSPTSGKGFMKNVNKDGTGDTHLWHVWHGLQPLNYYRKRYTRFCSEFGLESLCDMKTIKGFATPKDYSLKSNVFMAHQKCTSGNSKMLYYMSTKYKVPKNFDDIVYLSQLIQLECVKDATEHWRRNRGRCNGSLYWQLNDCWPVTSWSSIDYEGRYKALHYGAEHFNAPLTVSIEDDGALLKLHIINDFNESFDGSISYRVENFCGEECDRGASAIHCDKTSAKLILELDYKKIIGKKNLADKVFIVELYDKDGFLVMRKTNLFVKEKNAKFAVPKLNFSVIIEGETAFLTITTDKFARNIMISVENTYQPLSDNFFDMLAGEEVTVSMPSHGLTAEEIYSNLSVKTVNAIEAKGNAFTDAFLRLKISLRPINIANRFYYHFT